MVFTRSPDRRGTSAGATTCTHPQSPDLPVKAIARRTGLKTCLQLAVAARQLRYQPRDCRRLVRDLSQKADLAPAPALRDRYRMLQLRRIKRDKTLAILPHGPSSMPEARLGPPEQPSILSGMKGRATGFKPGS